VRGGPWRVGVRHPEAADQLCAVLELTEGAVATSARYERGDHIIDGRTGAVATGLDSLTIVAPSLTLADTVATAAFAMGREGVEWAAGRAGCEVFAVVAGGEVLRTAGVPVVPSAG
jgi:thiamine biosynthesis lipoprotein